MSIFLSAKSLSKEISLSIPKLYVILMFSKSSKRIYPPSSFEPILIFFFPTTDFGFNN